MYVISYLTDVFCMTNFLNHPQTFNSANLNRFSEAHHDNFEFGGNKSYFSLCLRDNLTMTNFLCRWKRDSGTCVFLWNFQTPSDGFFWRWSVFKQFFTRIPKTWTFREIFIFEIIRIFLLIKSDFLNHGEAKACWWV